MSNKGLYSFDREGGWSSSYSHHYESSWLCFFEYQETIATLLEEENRLTKDSDLPKDELAALIHHQTDHLHRKAYRSATSALLYACMAIEGFVNHYGTKRLGGDLYQRILERVGITEKLSLLHLVCFENRLFISNNLIKEIRTLFDQRNALVHPKTTTLTPENVEDHLYIHPREIGISNALRILELFIDNMCEMDTDIRREWHFNKPTKPPKPMPNNGTAGL